MLILLPSVLFYLSSGSASLKPDWYFLFLHAFSAWTCWFMLVDRRRFRPPFLLVIWSNCPLFFLYRRAILYAIFAVMHIRGPLECALCPRNSEPRRLNQVISRFSKDPRHWFTMPRLQQYDLCCPKSPWSLKLDNRTFTISFATMIFNDTSSG